MRIKCRVLPLALLATLSMPALADEPQHLRIIGEAREFIVQTPGGPFTIRRAPTQCASATGILQPLVPLAGVHPVTEIEVLQALNDPAIRVVDMRDEDDPLPATIPNSYHIPYNELEDRMDELGCVRVDKVVWNCAKAPAIIAFCKGPMCLQSPSGVATLVKAGFPVDRISYYRGGMMDWQALGLTTVKGSRSIAK